MRADYDSQGDTLAIDVLGAGANVDAALAAVAEHYELDIEALKAAARSALEAPDRQVVLEVLERA